MLLVLSFKLCLDLRTSSLLLLDGSPGPFEEFGDENKRMLAKQWQWSSVTLLTQPDLHGCALMGLQGIAVKRQQGEIDEAETGSFQGQGKRWGEGQFEEEENLLFETKCHLDSITARLGMANVLLAGIVAVYSVGPIRVLKCVFMFAWTFFESKWWKCLNNLPL